MHMLVACALVSMVFGFFYGIYMMRDDLNNRLYLIGFWSYKANKYIALRIVFLLVTLAIIGIPLILVVGKLVKIAAIKYLSTHIGLTLMGIVITYGVQWASRKYNWYDYEVRDIDYLHNNQLQDE